MSGSVRKQIALASERTRGRYTLYGGTAKSAFDELQSSLDGQAKQSGQEYDQILDKLVALDGGNATPLHSHPKTRHVLDHDIRNQVHEVREWIHSTQDCLHNLVSFEHPIYIDLIH